MGDVHTDLRALVEGGLVSDIFRMDRAHGLLQSIGTNAADLNDKANGNFGELFGAFQAALVTECALAAARIYDPPKKQYSTRCMRATLDFVTGRATEFTAIREPYQLSRTLSAYGLPNSLSQSISNGPEQFARALTAHYYSVLSDPQTQKTIGDLKVLRNKVIAHNQNTAPISGPTWVSLRTLVTHAKSFVGALGWAYLSVVYDHDGRFILSDDAQRPSNALNRLIAKLTGRDAVA